MLDFLICKTIIPETRWSRGLKLIAGTAAIGSAFYIELSFVENGFCQRVIGWNSPFDFYHFDHAGAHGDAGDLPYRYDDRYWLDIPREADFLP